MFEIINNQSSIIYGLTPSPLGGLGVNPFAFFARHPLPQSDTMKAPDA